MQYHLLSEGVQSAENSALNKGGLKGPPKLCFSCNSLELLVLFEAFFVTKELLETVANSGWKAEILYGIC